MTVRGGGGPMDSMAYHAVTENGSRRFGASQPMRITASWFRSLDPPHTRLWRDSALERELPSNRHLADSPTAFDGAAVLGAVKAQALRSGRRNGLPGRTKKPIKKARKIAIAALKPLDNIDPIQGTSGESARPKVPMRRRGADCLVVVMKRGNARGAKGAGHRL